MSSMQDVLDNVKKLIDDYVECWVKGGSGIKADVEDSYIADNITPCEFKYLIIQHYRIHDLPFEVLRKLPALLLKTHVAQNVNHDHKYLWAWTAQLINGLKGKLELLKRDGELLDQLNLVFRVNLLSTSQIVSNYPELTDILANNFKISAHLAFPLLERLLKTICKCHVDINGSIHKPFDIPLRNRVMRYRVQRKKISRVGHLLYLFYMEYASTELKRNLEEFCNLCEKIYTANKGRYMFKFVDRWRNIIIHGERFWSTMNAAIINLITLILLHEIPYDTYLKTKKHVLRNILFWKNNNIRAPWIFYPPKL